jgi:hypothetical protein
MLLMSKSVLYANPYALSSPCTSPVGAVAELDLKTLRAEFHGQSPWVSTVDSRRGFDLHLFYKAHMAVAGRRGEVIAAAVATTWAKPDEHLLSEMLWHHNRLSDCR